MEIPEYYSAKAVETIANESAAARAEREEGTADGVQPNIIAIMSDPTATCAYWAILKPIFR